MKPTVRDLLAVVFASTLPLAMAWLGFVALANETDREQSLLAQVYAGGKFVQFTFPAVYVILSRWHSKRIGALGEVTLSRSQAIAVGIAFAAVVDVAMAGLYVAALRNSSWLAGTPDRIFGKLQEFQLATPIGYLAIGFFICVLHSLLEEYYWRWFVFGVLREFVSLPLAIAISSVAFMAHHVVILYVYLPGHFWSLAVPLSLGVAIGGAFWAWLYDRGGSLLAPWLSHIVIDAAILLIGYDLLRGMW